MSEIHDYNPENTEYGTKHDGEFVFPDSFKAALEKQIIESLKAIEHKQNFLFDPYALQSQQQRLMDRACMIYTELMHKHSASYAGELTELEENLYLAQVSEQIAADIQMLEDKLAKLSAVDGLNENK